MEDTPTRMCLACRGRAAKASLVRLGCSRGAVVVDPDARLPGRGAYVCGDQDCLDTVLRHAGAALRKALRRSDLDVDERSLRAAWVVRRMRQQEPVSAAQASAGTRSVIRVIRSEA